MRVLWQSLIATLMLVTTIHGAMAQPAIEGAQAHPMVPLPQGSYITRDELVDFAIIEFPSGEVLGRGEYADTTLAEGAHRQLEYTIDGTETASLRLYRNYLDHFESNGFELIYSGFGDELGARSGYTFITQSRLLARTPATTSDTVGYILTRSPDGGTILSTSFFDRQGNRRIIVNAVELDDMEPLLFSETDEPSEPAAEQMPDIAALQQDVEELESGLIADGRVTVNAILFAFDSAEILPESAQALSTVAALMTDAPNLNLLVVGHTDAVGDFDYNLRLSLERASSVVGWLVERHGIAASRLRPAGAGPMSPVTTNRTDEGRAQNRRVELVELVQ